MKIYSKYGIQTHFKGNRTIKEMLVKPKDKDAIDRKGGAIYCYQCGELAWNEKYTGETSITFGERYKEHLKGTLTHPCVQHPDRTQHQPLKTSTL